MIESDETGQKKIHELVKNIDSEVFNDWERNFIREIRFAKYPKLTKHQKAVITRLTEFFNCQ